MVDGCAHKCRVVLNARKKFTKTIKNRECYGTRFQLAVWTEISKIKRGRKNVLWLANLLGRPKSARAVANACKNPYPGPIPCHRVIRSDGSLGVTGFGGLHCENSFEKK